MVEHIIKVVYYENAVCGPVWQASCGTGIVGYGSTWLEALDSLNTKLQRGDDS